MEIPLGVLRATQCCEPEATRYALNAIELQRLDDGRLQAATTNGKALAIVRWPGEKTTKEPLRLLIPQAAAEAIANSGVVKGKQRALIALERGNNGLWSLVTRDGNRAERIDFAPLDGRYPDVNAVIPTMNLARSVSFDARLLRDLLSALIDASGLPESEEVPITFTFDAAANADSTWEAAEKTAVLSRKREGEPELLAAIMPMSRD